MLCHSSCFSLSLSISLTLYISYFLSSIICCCLFCFNLVWCSCVSVRAGVQIVTGACGPREDARARRWFTGPAPRTRHQQHQHHHQHRLRRLSSSSGTATHCRLEGEYLTHTRTLRHVIYIIAETCKDTRFRHYRFPNTTLLTCTSMLATPMLHATRTLTNVPWYILGDILTGKPQESNPGYSFYKKKIRITSCIYHRQHYNNDNHIAQNTFTRSIHTRYSVISKDVCVCIPQHIRKGAKNMSPGPTLCCRVP